MVRLEFAGSAVLSEDRPFRRSRLVLASGLLRRHLPPAGAAGRYGTGCG